MYVSQTGYGSILRKEEQSQKEKKGRRKRRPMHSAHTTWTHFPIAILLLLIYYGPLYHVRYHRYHVQSHSCARFSLFCSLLLLCQLLASIDICINELKAGSLHAYQEELELVLQSTFIIVIVITRYFLFFKSLSQYTDGLTN